MNEFSVDDKVKCVNFLIHMFFIHLAIALSLIFSMCSLFIVEKHYLSLCVHLNVRIFYDVVPLYFTTSC